MDIKKIESEEQYDAILKRIEEILNAEPNTKEGKELEHLSQLIKDYDNINYPFGE